MRIIAALFVAAPLFAAGVFQVDLSGPWRFAPGDDPSYARPDFDDHQWPSERPVEVPLARHWLRRTVALPPLPGGGLTLKLGIIRGVYEVYVNGVRIGVTPGFDDFENAGLPQPRIFTIPQETAAMNSERMIIAIRCRRAAMQRIWRFDDHGPWAITAAEPAPAGDALDEFHRRKAEVSSILIVGTLLAVMALLSLSAWYRDRASVAMFWFGLYALSAAYARFLLFFGLHPLARPFNSFGQTPHQIFESLLSTAFEVEFVLAALAVPRRWLLRTLLWGSTAVSLSILYDGGSTLRLSASAFCSDMLIAGSVIWAWWTAGKQVHWRERLLWLVLLVEGLSGVEDFVMRRFLGDSSARLILTVGDSKIDRRDILTVALAGTVLAILMARLRADLREKQRMAGELAAAGEIQKLLLENTALAELGLSLDAHYSSALEVGGDFYCVVDGQTLVLGDVSGKGLKAAMVVSLVVGALRATTERSPARVLAALNRAVMGQVDGFITCCCLHFSEGGRLVTIANAGHPAPYLNGAEVRTENGLPLGLTADGEYTESAFALDPGSVLTVVSDGVIEAANASGELFGFDRTRAISTESAQEIADAAKQWGQNDDITVVTVRRSA